MSLVPSARTAPLVRSNPVFVHTYRLFGHDTILQLMAAWALGTSNEHHIGRRIVEARAELARGTSRLAVVADLGSLFNSMPVARIHSVTDRLVAARFSVWASPSSSGLPLDPTGVALVSDLVLDTSAAERLGSTSVMCFELTQKYGRTTGEIFYLGDHERLFTDSAS